MGNAGTDPASTRVIGEIWEPARGGGQMVAALWQAGFDVVGSNITQGVDFLGQAPEMGVSAIIINPSHALAQKFIERDDIRIVAVLLRTDFDHAARRVHLLARLSHLTESVCRV
jgi:hypothetical protein